MPTFTPVDGDPFASESGQPQATPARIVIDTTHFGKTTPVDHDPFAVTVTDRMEGIGRSIDAGLARGVAGIGGFVGDMTDGVAAVMSAGRNAYERHTGQPESPPLDRSQTILSAIPTSAQLRDTIQREFYQGEPAYEPHNRAEEFARTTGEFLPNAVGGVGRRIVQRAGQVLLPAAVSEGAGQATKGTAAEPWARFTGALAGGGLSVLLNRPGTTAAAIKSQLPADIPPHVIDQAEALMLQARRQGIDLAWPEAISQVADRPVLTNLMRHLEASPQTEAQMSAFFGRRPQQVEQAARGQFDNISPANQSPSTIGPAVGQAMEGTVNDVRSAINAKAEPFYKASEAVRLAPQEMSRVRALPGYQEARDAVRNDPQLNRYVSHLPDDSVGFLNEVKKQLDNSAKNAVGPLNAQPNMQRAAGLGKDASSVRNTASNASLDYATALAVESVGREKYLKPLLDGPIGKLAKKDTATQDAINALFPKNPLPNSEHEIGLAVSALAKRNPRAATDLVRAHVESVFNQAAKDLQTGANQAGGAKFRTQLVGNAQERLNLREAVEALPNGAERWNGFNKFLDVLEATGTRQGIGSKTAYNNELLRNSGNGGVLSDAAKTGLNPMQFGQKFIDRYERYKLGKDLSQLANVLTDPGAGTILRSIARVQPGSEKARLLAFRLLTYAEASRGTPVQKTN